MNKRFIKAVALILCIVLSGQIHAQDKPQASLTLDECLQIALSDNPTVKVSDMEVSRMDFSKKEVIGQLLPNIDFGGQYSRTLAKQTMYMNFGGFGSVGGDVDSSDDSAADKEDSGDGGIKMGLDNSWSLGFQASMPIIAPQLWKTLQVSDAQIARSLEAAKQSRQSLVNQVKAAFYALLLAEDSQKVIKESYDMAALTHSIYEKQYAAGAASDYDVLRTSVAMKNIEPQLLEAEIAIKRARLQLQVLMGMDDSVDIHANDRLSNYEQTMYGETLSINPDFSNNSDIRLMDMDYEIMKKNVTIQKLAYVPTIALTANYNWTAMNNGSPFSNLRWNPYSTVGVSLSVPIFSGGQRWNKLKQAKIQADELSWQRENLHRTISMQTTLAIDNIKINVKQIASCSESMAQADRAHSIMEKSFEIGAASYLELRDSELALTQSRLAYYQAIYNYLVANSELELLLGNAPIDKYIK